jgi:proteasome lid subunit RPN8/RPN11
MSSISEQERHRRIDAEIDQLYRLAQANPKHLKVERVGDKAILYFSVQSYVTGGQTGPHLHKEHVAQITFMLDNLQAPNVSVQLSPILFHPNILSTGEIRWLIPEEGVERLAIRLWQLYNFQYINFNKIKNPRALQWYNSHLGKPLSTESLFPAKTSTPKDFQQETSDSRSRVTGSNEKINGVHALQEQDKAISPVSQSSQEPLQQEPIRTSDPNAQSSSSGFRRKGAVRTHQPLTWSFPASFWEGHQRTQYADWTYNVPGRGYPDNYLKVVILESALRTILLHASGDRHNERFGILVGGVFSEPKSGDNWVEIVDMLPAVRVHANSASVEVSNEEISRLNEKVDQILTSSQETVRKIGWYHTHPNYGIFMSSTDQTNQRLCYTAEWQVALVVDPIRKQYGAFSGPECQPLHSGLLVISETEAEKLDTPAYRAWQSVEMRSQQTPQEASIPPVVAGNPSPRDLPGNQRSDPVGQQVGSDSTPIKGTGDVRNHESESYDLPDDPKARNKVLRNLTLPWIGLIIISAVLISIISWLTFSLLQSNSRLASAESYQTKQASSNKLLLQQVQQKLNVQINRVQSDEVSIHQAQSDLIQQAQNLKATDPAAYRKILRTVVALDQLSNYGIAAIQMLSEDINYAAVLNETVTDIAIKFSIDPKDILRKNPGVKLSDHFKAGQILVIPGEKV